MKIKFLGTSEGAGIPVHNCKCLICSKYRIQKRQNLSTCAYIEINNKIILLDAGIENIATLFDGKKIEAVLLTHFHGDHCLGLLRLRHSLDSIKCFHPSDEIGFSDLYKHNHSLIFKELASYEEFTMAEIKFTAIPLKHSKNCLGYLIEYCDKKIVYLTDCFDIDKRSLEVLKEQKIDYAFIDACYDERQTSGNHLNYIQASNILDELNVKNGFLMHISHHTQSYIMENNIELKYKYIEEGFSLEF